MLKIKYIAVCVLPVFSVVDIRLISVFRIVVSVVVCIVAVVHVTRAGVFVADVVLIYNLIWDHFSMTWCDIGLMVVH